MDMYEPSRKEITLAVVFSFSGLLAFALSFTMLQSNGRPLLFAFCIGVCLICLFFSNNKKGVIGTFVALFVVRLFWALIVTRW